MEFFVRTTVSLVVLFLALRCSRGSSRTTALESLQISPVPVLQALYKGAIEVSVYKKAEKNHSTPSVYYYTPAFMVNRNSSVVSYTNQTNRPPITITVSVLLWNDDYQAIVQSAVAQHLDPHVAQYNVRLLPIKAARFFMNLALFEYPSSPMVSPVEEWKSCVNQSKIEITFGIGCPECDQPALARAHAERYLSLLNATYSLTDLVPVLRTLHLKLNDIRIPIQKILNDNRPHLNLSQNVYLTTEDANCLTGRAAEEILKRELPESEFVTEEQGLFLNGILQNSLELHEEPGQAVYDGMGNALTCWYSESGPYKTTKLLNELYEKADANLKTNIKEAVIRESRMSSDEITAIGRPETERAFSSWEGFGELQRILDNFRYATTKAVWNDEKNRFLPSVIPTKYFDPKITERMAVRSEVQVKVFKRASDFVSRIFVLLEQDGMYV